MNTGVVVAFRMECRSENKPELPDPDNTGGGSTMKTLRTHFKSVPILLLLFALLFSCTPKDTDSLIIYTYDSFAGEWGPGPVVFPAFEKATGIDVEVIALGDAGQVLARLIDEKDAPRADVIIGIDGNLLPKALASGVLQRYRPDAHASVPPELVMDPQWHVTPYDWGSFAIMWDSEKLPLPPSSLADLTKPEFSQKLILMDPRTSTPGLGFLLWTQAVFDGDLADYWNRLKPSILTMSPGWDTGYGLFTAGEAPLVVSYTTSAAYHAEYEVPGRYKALEFPEGHLIQIEGAAVVAKTRHTEAARKFLDYMLSEEFQAALPLTNWMYPVLPTIKLPASYVHSPKPDKILTIPAARLSSEMIDSSIKTALDALRSH